MSKYKIEMTAQYKPTPDLNEAPDFTILQLFLWSCNVWEAKKQLGETEVYGNLKV